MTKTAAPRRNLRALIQDRRSKDARPAVRMTICFDPDALNDLRDLLDERAERDRAARDQKDPDPRMGRVDSLAEDIARLEEEVAETSVVASFRVPTREKQADYNRMIEEGNDVDPIMVRECFQYFMRDNEPLPDDELGKADLDAWLEVASRGEVNAIAYKIAQRSMDTPDFPASVKRSMATGK